MHWSNNRLSESLKVPHGELSSAFAPYALMRDVICASHSAHHPLSSPACLVARWFPWGEKRPPLADSSSAAGY